MKISSTHEWPEDLAPVEQTELEFTIGIYYNFTNSNIRLGYWNEFQYFPNIRFYLFRHNIFIYYPWECFKT